MFWIGLVAPAWHGYRNCACSCGSSCTRFGCVFLFHTTENGVFNWVVTVWVFRVSDVETRVMYLKNVRDHFSELKEGCTVV